MVRCQRHGDCQTTEDACREKPAPLIPTAGEVSDQCHQTDPRKDPHPGTIGELVHVAELLSQRHTAADDQQQTPKETRFVDLHKKPPFDFYKYSIRFLEIK